MISSTALLVVGALLLAMAAVGRERLLRGRDGHRSEGRAWLLENGYLSVLPEPAWRLANAALGAALVTVALLR
jgi:hypothetical protein